MTYGLIGTITRSLNNAVYIPIFYIQLDLYSAELTLIPMLDRQYHTVVLHSRDPRKMTYTLKNTTNKNTVEINNTFTEES